MNMNDYGLDVKEVPVTKTDWGRIQPAFDAAEMDSTSGFNLAYIVYNEPHYSGIHDDNEVIYILEGEGKAIIGGKEVPFKPECLLKAPKGVEHSFAEISKGPVKAVVIHFG
jgi:mannose-6-phosphate isomerase-like protein (cupin superfamily)